MAGRSLRFSLADLPDTLKAVPAVSDGVLPIVTIAEIGEMPFKDGVELIAITRNVLGPRRSHQLNSASCRRNKQ